APCLEAAGLATLPADARVECETVRVERGREVSRILAIDFSAALPLAAPHARAAGGGLPAAGPGMEPTGGSAVTGRELPAGVQWFDPAKGYGFFEAGGVARPAASRHGARQKMSGEPSSGTRKP
ncbi:MAG: hypothetical protein OXE57_04300, partial [Alphaproteobacteria bacterium]|nr:hypothetical protein [Alphaproteobacteria bacterium]